MSKFVKIVVLAVLLYIPAVVQADPLVLINFDDPIPPNPGVFLTTIFFAPGGVFAGTAGIVVQASPFAVSPPQAAFPFQLNPLSNDINGIQGRFAFFNPNFQSATTSQVSFNVVGSQGTWTAFFFDQTNGSDSDFQTGLLGMITGDSDQLVVFSSSAGIHRFVLIPSAINAIGIDNLQFNQPQIPEPASLVLLSLGVGGLLARKYRSRRSKSGV